MIIEALTSGLTIKLVLLWLENYVFSKTQFFCPLTDKKIEFKTWLVLTSVPLVIIRLYSAHRFKSSTHFLKLTLNHRGQSSFLCRQPAARASTCGCLATIDGHRGRRKNRCRVKLWKYCQAAVKSHVWPRQGGFWLTQIVVWSIVLLRKCIKVYYWGE